MPATPPRLSRPVFLSSTFRDTHAERDWLRARVFPEFEERLRQRRCDLEAIDLRWGVETVSAGEEQAKELLVLKVCLAEIERCRPFLIVLMGDRYGWVPPPERMAAATEEAGFKTDVAGKSVTALEIEFGVLDSPDQRRRSHFYFREPLPYGQMPPAVAAQFSEAHNPAPGAADAAARLDALKARIERQLPGRVRRYRAAWDPKAQQVTGLEAFGQMVLEDLWADLCDEIPETPPAVTWQDEERFTLEESIARHTRNFVGREEVTKELLGLALSPAEAGGPWGACVTGVTGSGKSAFFAQLVRRLRETDALVLAHAAGISIRAGQVDALLRRWVQELAAFLSAVGGASVPRAPSPTVGGDSVPRVPEPITENSSGEEVEKAFHQLLGQAAARGRVVLLIDALNQFDPSVRAQHLTWLPKLWPPNARLIATAIPGTESKALLGRDGVVEVQLPLLSESEAEAIAVAVCRRYHRSVHPDVVRALLAKKRPDGASAAGIPLWLELAIEELNLLDADDFRRMDREFSGTPEQRLHQLLLTVAGELPPDVEGLYGWMLARAEELHGKLWATAFANLIALSRTGWRESDFQAMLPTFTGEAWDPLRFAALRRTFRAHIVRRGALGQWDFHHAQTRAAVLGRNLPDEAARRNLHAALADHLETLPRHDPLRQSELMAHLVGTGDRLRAGRHYASPLTGVELQASNEVLATEVLATTRRATDGGMDWVLSLLDVDQLTRTEVGRICNRFVLHLADMLQNQAALTTRLSLLQAAEAKLLDLVGRDPNNTEWLRDLSVAHNKVGDVHRDLGEPRRALPSYLAANKAAQDLVLRNPTSPDWRRDLWVTQTKLGEVLRELGEHGKWLEACKAALATAEGLAAQYPGSPQALDDLAMSHNKVGDILRSQEGPAAALDEYRLALQLYERLALIFPRQPARQRGMAVAHNRIGNALTEKGDTAGALAAYCASQAIFERLAAEDPGNLEWQRSLAVSYLKIGGTRFALGDADGSARAHAAMRRIIEGLAVMDPANTQWQHDLAVSYAATGKALLAGSDRGGALRAFQAGVTILGRLAEEHPGNHGFQRDVALYNSEEGDLLSERGMFPEASVAYRAAVTWFERLCNLQPDNAEWLGGLSECHLEAGEALRSAKNYAEALKSYRNSLAICEELAKKEPTSRDRQRALSVSHSRIGNVLLEQEDPAAALEEYGLSLAIRSQLAKQDGTKDDWRDLSVSIEKVGSALEALNQSSAALQVYQNCLSIRERLAASDRANAEYQRDLAAIYHQLGAFYARIGKPAEGKDALRRCLHVLLAMKKAGMPLDPVFAKLVERIQ